MLLLTIGLSSATYAAEGYTVDAWDFYIASSSGCNGSWCTDGPPESAHDCSLRLEWVAFCSEGGAYPNCPPNYYTVEYGICYKMSPSDTNCTCFA